MKATLLEHALVCTPCRAALERLLLEQDCVQHAIEAGIYPPMRRQGELQSAHDILLEALGDKALREKFFPDSQFLCQVAMAADALCWALNHTHLNDSRGERRMGHNFHGLILGLEAALRRDGLLQTLREPPPPAPKPPQRKSERKPPEPAVARKDPAPLEFEFGTEE